MSYRNLILADSPALYWPLDATYGATDQSGNGRDGTGQGGITIGGYSGSPISGESTATEMDGSNDHFDSTYTPFVTDATVTVAGWAYRDDTAAAHALYGSDGDDASFVRLDSGGQNVVVTFDNNGTWRTFTGAWPGSAQWVHWAVVMDDLARIIYLYINGSYVGQKSGSALGFPGGNFTLGVRHGAANPFNGKMAHAAVWERELTASEIKSHYAAGGGLGNPASKSFIHQAERGQ